MSKTIYVKFTLNDELEGRDLSDIERLVQVAVDSLEMGYVRVDVWRSIHDALADEVDLDAVLEKAISLTDMFLSVILSKGEQTEDLPTAASTLVKLLKKWELR